MLLIIVSCSKSNKPSENEIDKLLGYFNNQDYNSTIQYIDSLMPSFPKDDMLYQLKGRSLFNLGKDKEALDCINKSIEINPYNSKNYGYRATMLIQKANYDVNSVLEDLNKALKADPNCVDLLMIKAKVYKNNGYMKKALDEAEKILKIDSTDYFALVLKGNIYRLLGKNKESLLNFSLAIEYNPEDPLAYEQRGFLFMNDNKNLAALNDFKKVVKLNSLTNQSNIIQALGYNNRGFAFYLNDSIDKALNDINYAIKLFPDNSYAYKNRALVYIKIGEKSKACKDLQKAINKGFTEKYGNEVLSLIETYCN